MGTLKPGIYTIYWAFTPYTNSGISKVEIGINGVYTFVRYQDQYANPDTVDDVNIYAVDYFQLSKTGQCNFRIVADSQNILSTGFYINFAQSIEVVKIS